MHAQQSFDSEQQIELLAQAHAIVVDEAAWTFIVYDLNPGAMSAKVTGFQPAQRAGTMISPRSPSNKRRPHRGGRRSRQGVARS